MSIRRVKLKNGEQKWEVRVHESGRGSKRITRRFERKSDAEVFLGEFQEELRAKARSPFKTSSFQERVFRDEAAYWLADGKLRFSFGHLKRVEGILQQVLKIYGDYTLDRFTPELLSRIQQDEKLIGMSNATVNRKTEVITAILNCSAKHRRIPFNPSTGFKKLARPTNEMAFWRQSEASDFLAKIDELYPAGSEQRWIYVVYFLALNTALRAGEIWGLKVMDITEDGKSIWVRRQFNRVSLDFGPTKGKKARYVPCLPELYNELKALIETQGMKPDETIFRNLEGKPICHDNFADRQFQKDLKLWKGRSIRFHDLRHTATTLMIANGVDIKTVKEICGHADIATTMNYVHLVASNVDRVTQIFSIKPKSRKEAEGATEALED